MELFGVSVTTLEEVFLRVGRDHTEADVAADERLQQATPGRRCPVGPGMGDGTPVGKWLFKNIWKWEHDMDED